MLAVRRCSSSQWETSTSESSQGAICDTGHDTQPCTAKCKYVPLLSAHIRGLIGGKTQQQLHNFGLVFFLSFYLLLFFFALIHQQLRTQGTFFFSLRPISLPYYTSEAVALCCSVPHQGCRGCWVIRLEGAVRAVSAAPVDTWAWGRCEDRGAPFLYPTDFDVKCQRLRGPSSACTAITKKKVACVQWGKHEHIHSPTHSHTIWILNYTVSNAYGIL